MSVPARLGLYGAALVVVFGASAAVASAVVPEETVSSWTQQVEDISQEDTDH
ncbi:hypothetical protein [Ornithinimicrobium faecis]|uniref:Uncharacterized protein n=1 Tax=Ornithinimicrobium faecis TaxID=2934158 RepID=A0ABY4YXM9_9MICO|nr:MULTISPECIES: hypothetical protein [unclassified Ornithinimicrobium]USQ81362.1 hypothetical protein NF556_06860 [Ornithinimicrobium sp. HY1793]